jgi:hypothetical protein
MQDLPNKEEKPLEKPKAGIADAGHLAVRIALSTVPVIGGAAKELFNTVIAPPLAKRQAEWMDSIAQRLTELEKQYDGFEIENLIDNENFISTVFFTTTLNIRTHQEEKIRALENAVLNSALSINIEEDLQHIFLNFIDELTPTHLIVLKYFASPKAWLESKNETIPNFSFGGQNAIFNIAFPELKKNQEFAKRIVDDLSERGLAQDWQAMHIGVTATTIFAPRITQLGNQFLSFIKSPIKQKKKKRITYRN